MLIFKKLTMENFGPYRNSATLNFPDKGIVIIRGRNGRGKTTILSALRFVLFGKITIYGKEKISLFEYINQIGFENGKYSYSVSLDVDVDGVRYRLFRSYEPKGGILIPRSENDYLIPDLMVKALDNSVCLSGSKAQHIANKIMTEIVSRFYLFDGELLKEYETELSNDDSHTARRIRESIERILGVPILKNACSHTQKYAETMDVEYRRLSSSDKEKAKIANTISQIANMKTKHEESISELEKELTETQQERIEAENRLTNLEDARELSKDLGVSQQKIDDINKSLKSLKETLSSELADGWRGVLVHILTIYKQKYNDEYTELKNKEELIHTKQAVIQQLCNSISSHKCELCGHPIDSTASSTLRQRVEDHKHDLAKSGRLDRERLDKIQEYLHFFNSFDIREDIVNKISSLDRSISANERTLILEEQNYERIQEELAACQVSNNDIKQLVDKIAKLKSREASLKDNISKEESAIIDCAMRKKKLEEKMEAMPSTANIEIAFTKKKFAKDLYDLFLDSVGRYQDELKQSVERDATDIFRRLTGEVEYTGLKINENYRLDIIRETGDTIPLRSSGYEHLVAFSLIGALHKNAPMCGPLFMDTSFGRLDEINSENLIRALPTLSDQVILLVHKRELNEAEVQNLISHDVKAKYSITRISARESTLELEEGR